MRNFFFQVLNVFKRIHIARKDAFKGDTRMLKGIGTSDVLIIGNNRLIDRKAVDYDDRFSIINNRSLDACTKHVYNKIHMHNKAT